MNIQARPLRVSAASEELHIAATRKTHTLVLEREYVCAYRRTAPAMLRSKPPTCFVRRYPS